MVAGGTVLGITQIPAEEIGFILFFWKSQDTEQTEFSSNEGKRAEVKEL